MNTIAPITIHASINAPREIVWTCYTEPEHIKNWNHASDDWQTSTAKNDVTVGGTFLYRMEAKDGSIGFDFAGTYTQVSPYTQLAYTMEDQRTVLVTMTAHDTNTTVTITFDPEQENTLDMQQQGWQAILQNFKVYTEERNKNKE